MVLQNELHFVLVPLMSPGHMIPMLDLARLLAKLGGVMVTFVTTPVNLSRIEAVISRMKESDLPVRFLSLQLPCKEVGLSEGCENLDLLPSPMSLHNFLAATKMLEEPLRLHLQQSSPRPSCIISDFCHPWTRHVARDLEVPRFDFYSMPCFALLCEHNLNVRRMDDGVGGEDGLPIVVPGLPLRVEVARVQAPGFFPRPEWAWMDDEIREAESVSHGVVVNTFAELEPEFLDLYERTSGKKVWAVGPGDKAAIDVEKCVAWLDAMKPRSVLYISFGTLVRSSLAVLVELGLGLEATRRPFIWSIKAGGIQAEVKDWLAQGFEERTRDRALIIRGWAPQVTILSHPSIGGFLTHCGWNSSLEGITAGVPILTWPGFSEQFLNERLLVDVLRVGVPTGVKTPVWDGTIADGDLQLNREEIQKTVERLMDAGVEGEERRRTVKELSKRARRAMSLHHFEISTNIFQT
ncbi:unnamed protein product [Spirodela intermedia]|uniref:Glycosyltransferase n=1 Tax=Spirodela intermedia TaxID=51605 RepID=A0A7I8J7Y8_SPIIN|nr:unnamed protein product [Spirodela intermedia]CAA6666348.1 unnamed protein product [Spirodela intermedia]